MALQQKKINHKLLNFFQKGHGITNTNHPNVNILLCTIYGKAQKEHNLATHSHKS